jgi:putative DNA primase/helicase
MIPAAPDIVQNTQRALRDINRSIEHYPHSHAAVVLAVIYQRYLKFCEEDGRWRFWNGLRWVSDSAAAVVNRLIIDLIGRHLLPLLTGLTPYQRSAMLGHGYLRNVEQQLRLIQDLHVKLAAFDADPFLIGTPGGAVDLRNGRLVKPQPEMMITLQTGCDPAGRRDRAPMWEAFIDWLCCGDKPLARFIRMWFGISLIGNVRDQRITFFWGDSANGKSVLFRAIARAAGSYHETASPSLFMVHGSGSSTGLTPGLIKVLRKRVVTGTEVPKGAEWDTQTIKQICSDEALAARQLFEAEVSIEPRCTVSLAANDLPAFTGLDDAVRRRFLTVHCRAKRAPAEQRMDYGLELFEAEGPGILRWMIEGAMDREMNGFIEPEVVRVASEEYFESEDVLAEFIAERYDRAAEGVVSSTELFTEWQAFNKALGRPRDMTHTMLSLRMQRMGFSKAREGGTGRMLFKGLTPKTLW